MNEKRSIIATVRMSPRDMEKFWRGARILWADAPRLTRSDVLLTFAKAGLESLLKVRRKRKP